MFRLKEGNLHPPKCVLLFHFRYHIFYCPAVMRGLFRVATLIFKFLVYHFFPVQLQTFPVPLCVICNYYRHNTDLADLSSFNTNLEIFIANIKIPFTFRIMEFTTWANQIPCVLAKFPNSLCFPWQGFYLAFSPVFPVQWVPVIVLSTAEEVRSWPLAVT